MSTQSLTNGFSADGAAFSLRDSARKIGLGLLLVCGVFLLITTWNISLQTIAKPDEPRYADAARNMLRTGDWVVPIFNGELRLVKPIGFYWLIALTGKIGEFFGLSLDLGFRLGPLLMGLLGVVATYFIGVRLKGVRLGILAAGILMSNSEYHKVSRELVVDMTLTACLTSAWLFVFLALERLRSARSALLYLFPFYLCLGLACMVKGPAPVGVFVVVPLLAYLAWTRSLKLLLKAGLWWGAPLALAIGMVWFVLLREHGIINSNFFSVENLDRAIGAKDHVEPIPYWFYIEHMGDIFAPWVVILPFVLIWAVSCWKKNGLSQTSPQAQFLLCWLGVGFALLGLSMSKRDLYLLPLFPPLALSIAWVWEQALLSREGLPLWARARLRLELSLFFVIASLAGGVLVWTLGSRFSITNTEKIFASVALLTILGLSLNALAQFEQGRRWAGSLRVLGCAMVLVLGYEGVVTPLRERTADRVDFFKRVQQQVGSREFVLLGENATEAAWYLDRSGRNIRMLKATKPNEPSELEKYFFGAPGTLLLTPEKCLRRSPALMEALSVQAEIPRGRERFILASPKQDVKLSPAVFELLRKSASDDADTKE